MQARRQGKAGNTCENQPTNEKSCWERERDRQRQKDPLRTNTIQDICTKQAKPIAWWSLQHRLMYILQVKTDEASFKAASYNHKCPLAWADITPMTDRKNGPLVLSSSCLLVYESGLRPSYVSFCDGFQKISLYASWTSLYRCHATIRNLLFKVSTIFRTLL